MSARRLFSAIVAGVALSACVDKSQIEKSQIEAGYVPVSDEQVNVMPAQPIDIIYGFGNARAAMSAASPWECLVKTRAQWELRGLGISTEPLDSQGRSTCMGKDGVVLIIDRGQAYGRGRLVAPAP